MAQQMINTGTTANDGTGDPLRDAFGKANSNFTELYTGLAAKAPLASPALTGTPTAPTATGGTNTTQIATTAFVQGELAGVSGGYAPGGTDVALTDGGTGASLSDPNADRLMFWDDSAGSVTWLTPGTGLSITGTTINATGGGGSGGELLAANNLSDLADEAAARGNLGLRTVTSQTGTSYTAVLADADTYIRFTNGSAVSFTIPPNSSEAFPVGTVIEVEQAGAGALSFVAGSGVTLNSRASDLTLAGQYAVAFAKKVATDTWTVNGDL